MDALFKKKVSFGKSLTEMEKQLTDLQEFFKKEKTIGGGDPWGGVKREISDRYIQNDIEKLKRDIEKKKKKIASLEGQNTKLKNKNKKLEEKIEDLKNRNNELNEFGRADILDLE